jgi:hypothetical protein
MKLYCSAAFPRLTPAQQILHPRTVGEIAVLRNLRTLLRDKIIKLLLLLSSRLGRSFSSSDSASGSRGDKSALGDVFGGAKLGPEVAVAQLEERAQVRETGGGDADCGFDTGPDDDGDLVV